MNKHRILPLSISKPSEKLCIKYQSIQIFTHNITRRKDAHEALKERKKVAPLNLIEMVF